MIREYTSDCVHCGFCLPTCPTYVLWREEMDSPRGRLRFAPGDLASTLDALREAVARPASGVAYVTEPGAHEPDAATASLVDSICAQLDPRGVLAA